MIFTDFINWFAFFWFLASWATYDIYSRNMSRTKSINRFLFKYRLEWIKNVISHDNRSVDILLLKSLTTLVNFLATTAIFATAGLITVIYYSKDLLKLLTEHPFVVATTEEQIQFKILILITVFIYAFFRLTWSMRLHTFCALILGAAPLVKGRELNDSEKKLAYHCAKISNNGGSAFNSGLRAYYFSLALLTWFISPWIFIPACTMVVIIIYLRDFHSKALKHLKLGYNAYFTADDLKKYNI